MTPKCLTTVIDNKIKNWDERSQFEIFGIKNLSLSDMETVKLYAEEYLKSGNISWLMKPLGSLAEILEKVGITK